MTEQLYVCSGRKSCTDTTCSHYKPHVVSFNCINGHCIGRAMPCIPYKLDEFNLKLVIKND